ncbi:MAG: hypothetical protein V4665_04580 [Patescibacteria group bacterium]
MNIYLLLLTVETVLMGFLIKKIIDGRKILKLEDLPPDKKLFLVGAINYKKDPKRFYCSVVWANEEGLPLEGELSFPILALKTDMEGYMPGSIIYTSHERRDVNRNFRYKTTG